jgi:hypothetical protein
VPGGIYGAALLTDQPRSARKQVGENRSESDGAGIALGGSGIEEELLIDFRIERWLAFSGRRSAN